MKKIDKLAQDATAAIKAGMSYGKYMAQKHPVKVEPPRPQGIRRKCECCGKVFYQQDRRAKKFCSDVCRERFYSKGKHQKKAEKPPERKICPICGKEFMAESYRNKYCGSFCAQVAQGERIKEYQRRKAGAEHEAR